MNIQQYGSTNLTLLTAQFDISLLHNCTKIQYLLYSNCSKCPPPVAKQFSARMSRDRVAEATFLDGCVCVQSLQKYDRAVLLLTRP